MSKVIDERVVSMQFDNKHFESNVQTTLSTLDKLKAKLNLKDSAKGLESISSAATKCNLSPLSNAVDNVGIKFNAMYTIADQALRNITNSAMAAGKRIVDALTIDPVKTGFSEYETKINSVQVIKANTRGKFDTEEEQMDTIYAALDRLNEYADRTIYNYTQMTDNVGKFVAQTGDIEKSVKAVEGLANLAGASGASASDMARATYQMSQALGGTIRKIDWNSLRNANMAGLELKNMLTDLAKVKGIDIDSMIESKGTFEDTLEEGWLTGDLFLEAMNIYSDAYSEAELAAMGFNEEQIKNFKDLAATAKQATTEVKTVSQMWDVLKETAQSGWTQTWELIVGDFDSAKALLSPLAEFFMGIINKMSDARNNLLQGALDLATPWKSITDKLSGGGFDNIKKVADSISDMTDKVTHFQDVVNRVWRGDFMNADTGRYDLLEAAGYDHRVVQDLVNLGAGYKITVEDIEASHKKFGLTLETNAEQTEEVTNALSNLSDEKLREAGLTEAEIKLYRDLEAEAERTGKTIGELADEMSKADGRSLLIDSLKNAGNSIITIFKAMGDAWRDIFPPMSVVQLYNIIKAINEFSKKLVVSEETAEDLTRVFKGLFAVIDIIGTVIGGGFRLAFKAVSGILGLFNMDILDAAANIGDMLVNVRDWIDEHSLLNKVLDKFGPSIKKAVKSISDWADETKPIATILKNIGSFFKKTGSSIMDWVAGFSSTDDIFGYILDSIKELPSKLFNALKTLGVTLGKSLGKIFEKPISVISEFKDKALDKLGPTGDSIGSFFKNTGSSIRNWVTGLTSTDDVFGYLLDSLKSLPNKLFSGLKTLGTTLGKCLNRIFEKPISVISQFKDKVLDKLGTVGDGITGFVDKIKNFVKELDIGFGEIVTILVGSGMIIALIKFASTFGKVVGILTNISDAFAGIGESISGAFDRIGSTARIVGLAIAIGILAKAFIELAKLEWDQFAVGVASLAVIAIILGGLTFALGMMAKKDLDIVFGAGVLIAMGAAIAILAYALERIAKIESDHIIADIFVLAGIGVALAGVTALLSKLAPKISKGSFTMIAIAAAILILITAVSKIDALTINDPEKVITTLGGLLIGLALVSKLANGIKVGSAVGILVMVGAILLFAHTLNHLAGINTAKIKANIDDIALILGMLAAVMLASRFAGKNAARAGVALFGISSALILVGVAIKLLASISPSDMAKGTDTITQILAMFALLTIASALAGKNAAKAGAMLMEMSVALLIISGSILILSKIAQSNGEGLQAATDCIMGLMAMFAIIIAVSGLAKSAMGTIITLGIVLGLLTVAIGALSMIPKESLTTATGCLAAIMAMLAILISVTALINTKGAAFLKTSATLIVMAGVVALLGMVIAQLAKLDPGNALEATASLSLLLTSMSASLVLLGVVGKLGWGAFIGIGALVVLIAAIGGVMAAISAIVNDAEKAEAGLDTAIMVLEKIGLGIGSFIGGIIGGIGAGVFSGLKSMAEDLNAFMEELTKEGGFIQGAKSVDEAAISGVKNIIALLAMFTGVEFLESIGAAFESPFSKLANLFKDDETTKVSALVGKLTDLGNALIAFSDSTADLDQTDIDRIHVLADASKALVNVAGNIPNEGGLLGKLLGENDMSTFGKKLVDFGEGLVSFGESIRDLTEDDVAKIKTCADAAMALTAMADSVPNMGGKIAEFLGENDLSVFGEKLAAFGGSLVAYGVSIRNLTEDDIKLIKLSSDAGVALAGMADAVPNIGGKLAEFFGENDLAVFGEKLKMFGGSLVAYGTSIRELTDEDIENIGRSAEAAKALANMADSVPNMGGKLSVFFGENDLSVFGTQISGFGDCLMDYATSVLGITDEHINAIRKSGTAMDALVGVAKKVPNEGGLWQSIAGDNNVLGFANGMSSLGKCIINYVKAVENIDDDTVETIKNSKDAVEQLAKIAKSTPELGKDQDLAGFAKSMPSVGSAISKYASAVRSVTEDDVKAAKRSAKVVDEIKNAVKKIPGAIKDISEVDVDGAISKLKSLITFSGEVDGVNTDGLSSLSETMEKVAKKGINAFIRTLDGSAASINNRGVAIITNFTSGLTTAFPMVLTRFNVLMSSVVAGISSKSTSFYSAGANLARGFARGVDDFSYLAINEAQAMVNSVVSIVRNGLKINSPSKVFMEIGRSIPEGFAIGINDFGSAITKSTISMADVAIDGTRDAIYRIAEAINTDIDSQPTIRPVLDLSDVKSGASSINGLFGMQPSVDLLTNVGSINNMMSRRQNVSTTNDDVVAAIKDLKQAISESSGDSYSIGGITYDDGSNIASTIQALIRASRIEGRI